MTTPDNSSEADNYAIQFLTSSGWKTDREVESEGLAIAHFSAIGRANVWTGHVRIIHGSRVVRSTLQPDAPQEVPDADKWVFGTEDAATISKNAAESRAAIDSALSANPRLLSEGGEGK